MENETFEELYPYAEYQEYKECEGDEVVKDNFQGLCWDCGRSTRWVSISFRTYLCSPTCLRNKWNEYWKATHAR